MLWKTLLCLFLMLIKQSTSISTFIIYKFIRHKCILNTLNGKITSQPPIWIMRQAGRYLPEYRFIRNTELNFIEFCLNAEKASEVTCQPIKKFNLDAAIIFSDILLVLHMLDFKVSFIKNKGPKLKKLNFGEKLTFNDWTNSNQI